MVFMKKIILIITSVILALVLIVAIALAGNTFFYYPHYKENKQEANIKIENTEQIKMMSYNLRCISPTDFGKKRGFTERI
jgi:flagellar basal body-associated protein FliL